MKLLWNAVISITLGNQRVPPSRKLIKYKLNFQPLKLTLGDYVHGYNYVPASDLFFLRLWPELLGVNVTVCCLSAPVPFCSGFWICGSIADLPSWPVKINLAVSGGAEGMEQNVPEKETKPTNIYVMEMICSSVW